MNATQDLSATNYSSSSFLSMVVCGNASSFSLDGDSGLNGEQLMLTRKEQSPVHSSSSSQDNVAFTANNTISVVLSLVFLLFVLLQRRKSQTWLPSQLTSCISWICSGAFLHPNGSPAAHRHIPGPSSFPVVGSRWIFWKWIGPYAKYEHTYHEANEEMYSTYGPVVREECLFQFPLIHLFDKEDILTVLHEKSRYPLRPPNVADLFYRLYRKEFYPDIGIVNLNGSEWHRLRRLLTPPLTNRNTPRAYAPQMNDIAEDFTNLLNTKKDCSGGVVTDFKNIVYRAGLETVSNLALDRRMGFLDRDFTADTRLIIESIQGYQTACNQAMYGLPLWKHIPKWCSPVFTRLVNHKDNLCATIGKLIDETLFDNMEEGAPQGESESNSILQQLLDNPELSVKDVKASVTDYITAGVDTIGNSIIFAMALVANNEKVQAKLHEELDRVLVKGEVIDDEKIQSLPYLKACVNESYRMYPTASQLARITEVPYTLKNGQTLPAYSVVLCHHRIASLQDENFTRAREFLPERWLDRDSFPVHTADLVMPFGAGKRSCPGKKLAQQEVHIIVAKMFARFKVALLDPFAAEFNWLLTPAGVRVKLDERV